jgi:hypothetical protein
MNQQKGKVNITFLLKTAQLGELIFCFHQFALRRVSDRPRTAAVRLREAGAPHVSA